MPERESHPIIVVDNFFDEIVNALVAEDVSTFRDNQKIFDIRVFAFKAVFLLLYGSSSALVCFLLNHPSLHSCYRDWSQSGTEGRRVTHDLASRLKEHQTPLCVPPCSTPPE
jgi:hypothetical protein